MNIQSILNSALRMSAPLILAGLGGLFTHKSGVLNIALEGMMLIGAFVAVLGSYITGNVYFAILLAIVAAVVTALVFSYFGITMKGNHIIIGLAVNIFASGIISYVLQSVFGKRGVFADPRIVGIKPVHMGFLEKIPLIGGILNDQTPIVYLSLIMVVLVNFIIYKTKFGLYLRVAGENEEAAKAVGLNINLIKYSSVIISSVFCALAGVNLSLENLSMFVENMTNGRGFIALAAIFCGKGTPIGTFVFSVLFGFADSMQMRLQSLNIPGAFIQMIPFIFIIVILTVVAVVQNRGKLSREGFDE